MARFGFVWKRLLQAIPLLLGVTFATFLILKITPGDPARAVLGDRATPQAVAQLRHQYGLDQNVFVQYERFLTRLLHGNLGVSNKSGSTVTAIIRDSWSITAWIIGLGGALAVVISVPVASLAAQKRDGLRDHAVRGMTTFGLGMPPFWVGIMLILFIALPSHLFPVGGGFGTSVPSHFRATFLPALTLAIALSPVLIRSLRSAMIDVLESEYVDAARSLGSGGVRLVRGHVFRNAVAPMIAVLATQIGYLLFGAVLMEQTFGLPGLGSAMVTAALERDYPVVIGVTLMFAVAVVVVHLLADVLLAVADPRVEVS